MRQVRRLLPERVRTRQLFRLAVCGVVLATALLAQQLLAFGGLFWTAVLITATLSAVNEWELRRLHRDLDGLATMAADLEQLRKFASTDGLTGIANRRAFDTILEREVARASRDGSTVALIMLDIDRFKQLNDTHGHQTGDDVLREVAAALAKACREYDTAARYGGDEFTMVLPNCSPDEAHAAADRLRLSVAEVDSVPRVTVSGGIATFPADGPDATSVVRAADQAMYESKRTGRNRVIASTRTVAQRASARYEKHMGSRQGE